MPKLTAPSMASLRGQSTRSFIELKETARGFFEPSSLDRRFSYTIPRTVKVQDARMGLSFYGMYLCIFIFVVVYQMGYSGGHVAFESVFGQVSFQVKRPTSADTPLSGENSYWNMSDSDRTKAAAGFLPLNQLPYCLNLTSPNAFCSDNPANKTYYCTPMSCAKAVVASVFNSTTNTTENVTTGYTTTGRCAAPIIPLQVKECRYLDEEWIAPIVQQRSVLVVSRVSWMYQNLTCEKPPADNVSCLHLFQPLSSTKKYHTVQPENFQIMFDHEVFTPTNGVHGKQADAFDAPFLFSDGRTYWPAQINPAGNGSFYRNDDKPWIPGYYTILGRHTIEVNTLLQAAGLNSLDNPTTGLFDSGSTFRYTGITVMLRIKYDNYEPFSFSGSKTPSYSYSTELGTTYAAVHQVTWQSVVPSNPALNGTRLFENRHGIKIVITQEGLLGVVTTVALMLFLGGAVALFAIASIVVDQIVVRFFMSPKTRVLLQLASEETVPTRAALTQYVKSVEATLGGQYEAPHNYWELEKELLAHEEVAGRKKPRPEFLKGVSAMQKMLDEARLERAKSDDSELKTAKELQLSGALAFARGISQPGQPELHRAMSSDARLHWKLAKEGVYAQVRASGQAPPPGLARVRTALAGRLGEETKSMSSVGSLELPTWGRQTSDTASLAFARPAAASTAGRPAAPSSAGRPAATSSAGDTAWMNDVYEPSTEAMFEEQR